MLVVAVVDDDEKAFAAIETMIGRYMLEEKQQIQYKYFDSAEKFLFDFDDHYDLVFMDVEMSGMSGIEAARELRQRNSSVYIIFVSNMAQYALEGYRVDAFDYFVKPAKYYDLKMRLDRVFRITEKKSKIKLSFDNGMKFLGVDELYYVEVINHTIIYHTKSGDIIGKRKSMNEVEGELSQYGFARCNVSYLVNLRHCQEISGNMVKVGNDTLPISRPKNKEFREKFANSILEDN